MKTLHQACAVAVVTVLLSATAFAGQTNCPGVVSPPPTDTSITTTVILAIIGLIN